MKYIKHYNESKYDSQYRNQFRDLLGKDEEIIDEIAMAVANKIGYKIIKYLNLGSYGLAFLLNDNKVLKLTTDECEAYYGLRFKKTVTKHLINYYDSFRVYSTDLNVYFYGLIMDYVTPITHDEQCLCSEIMINFMYWSELTSGKNVDYLEPEIEKFINNPTKGIKDTKNYLIPSNKEQVKWFMYQFKEIGKEILKYKVGDIWDMHTENLGKNSDGDLIYFDIPVIKKMLPKGYNKKFKIIEV